MAVRRCRIKRLALGVEAESEIDRVHGPEKRHVDQALVALKYRQAPAFKFNLAVLGKHGARIRTWKAFLDQRSNGRGVKFDHGWGMMTI